MKHAIRRALAITAGAAALTAVPAAAFAAPTTSPGAKATGNSGGTIFRDVGDWATHGCVSEWFGGTDYINAWAVDNYTAEPVSPGSSTYTEAGTFNASCDPMQGGMAFPDPVSGTFHGQITYASDGSMVGGTLTYRVGAQHWVFTESVVNGVYTENESQPLQN